MAEADEEAFARFMQLSAALTGFDQPGLWGTGCARDCWRQLGRVLPVDMLLAFPGVPADGDAGLRTLLASEDWGPVLRNVIRLWYLGMWQPLPDAWRSRFGASPFDTAQMLSSRAYKEALVWKAMGAHPMGARQQGFGAWAEPPPEPLP